MSLAATLSAERDRWVLWAPVGLAAGIGLYFSLHDEPRPFLGVAVAALAGGLTVLALRSKQGAAGGVVAAALPIAIVALGFALAQLETWRVATPMLDRTLTAVRVEGRVVDVELLGTGSRVTLAPDRIERTNLLPRSVRIKLRPSFQPPQIGERMSVLATLMPPPGPAVPGGFDFQRQAYFRGLGAVGYALGRPVVTPGEPAGAGGWLRELRAGMTARIRAALSPQTGGIAAALITGERGSVPPGVNDDYRNSGLAHLLVIAGLHMTLVTGFVFFATRALLALSPFVALRYPIKKWAALAALVVAGLYLLISGAAVPTQRAFVMVALGLLALLVDRLNLSMRAVAWAAGIVLAIDPAAVTGVSFQMSFAAVVGLIAFYETFGPRLAAARSGAGPFGRAGLHLAAIALTTIVATVGTAAFSIYHFNRFAVFSVLANVLAVPIAGFWVMPWAFASCLLMPFGLERIGLVPMGWGISAIEAVAHWTATLPLSVVDLPAMPDWGLIAIAAGGLWLAIWQTRWRRWGLLPMALGVASLWTASPPDLLAAEDGRLIAIRAGSGYLLSSEKDDKVEAEAWLRSAGGLAHGDWPAPGEAAGAVRCDSIGCIWRTQAGEVALVRQVAAADEDCRRAAVVVAMVPVRRACRAAATVVDHTDLRRGGTAAIWLGPPILVRTANAERGRRPWVIVPAEPVSSGEATRPADPAP
ncbi:MAG TPA: ComEC/Rec2 family competence protein [Stellaceae bacterium]|nr:ComEC/Rec2 family competence protein [Stellaceae bacterium]